MHNQIHINIVTFKEEKKVLLFFEIENLIKWMILSEQIFSLKI